MRNSSTSSNLNVTYILLLNSFLLSLWIHFGFRFPSIHSCYFTRTVLPGLHSFRLFHNLSQKRFLFYHYHHLLEHNVNYDNLWCFAFTCTPNTNLDLFISSTCIIAQLTAILGVIQNETVSIDIDIWIAEQTDSQRC